MQRFCQNPNCESPSVKEVRVSVRSAGDQKRSLCLACEEVFTWGVQYGTVTSLQSTAGVDRFLAQGGFVIITHNASDPSIHGPLEAWAYRGRLDFDMARPVTFGIGPDIHQAVEALGQQLLQRRSAKASGRSIRRIRVH